MKTDRKNSTTRYRKEGAAEKLRNSERWEAAYRMEEATLAEREEK